MLLKKSVIATTVGIAALGMSAAALANGSSYTTTNNTYSSNSYSNSGFNTSSDAGFVIGVQAGYGDTHWNDVIGALGVTTVDDTGFAARGFVGYDVNKNFGLEAGYTYLPTTTVTVANDVTSVSADFNSYAVDLLGKISLPVTPVFKIYAKAGIGYLHASGSNGAAGNTAHTGPAYGVGASYEIVPNLAIDATWLRYSGQGDLNSGGDYIPQADVGLIGLSYKFPTRA